jgi:hypothetical protein
VWLIVNWMIADRLATQPRRSAIGCTRTPELVRRHFQYFSPINGEGLGGASHLTAATTLFWLL